MEQVTSCGQGIGPVASLPRMILTRPTMRKRTGNAVCRCRSGQLAYTPSPRERRTFRGGGRPGSLGALGHPLRDLGLEEGQRQRAGRLVGVDVLALELAAADEQLAVAAQ